MRNNKNKVNIKARVNRHLRIMRDSMKSGQRPYKKFGYSMTSVFLFIVFLFPIYPALAHVFYPNTEYDFYRGDIDESSILSSSYLGDKPNSAAEEDYLLQNLDSFISVNTFVDGERDTTGSNEVLNYTVKPGESYDSIASEFNVSVNTILWANNFSHSHMIHPGDVIKIPPVTGVLYVVEKGDNLESIAKKYKIDISVIEKQNSISRNDVIAVGQNIMLPGAEKFIPKPVEPPKSPKPTKSTTTHKKSVSKPTLAKKGSTNTSQYTTNKGGYKFTRSKLKNRFYWGNCTWYVAKYKNVNWLGNANQWISRARAKGHATGQTPKVGAIVQFTGRGYNPTYGHVGIVIDIKGNDIIVSDMNYRRLNEITTRKVSIDDRAIDGYIYVD